MSKKNTTRFHHPKSDEEKSLKLVETSREEWSQTSFLKEIFMGNFDFSIINPFPIRESFSEEFSQFFKEYKSFLRDEVDADLIDREGKIPSAVIQRLREMKVLALKIGKEYGGHGFSQAEYNAIIEVTGSKDGNLAALLSAHQSIGVPQPLMIFGTEAQKRKYLTRIADGEISAFALTEANVGSDPANLETTVEDTGEYFLLNGEKLWCTNVMIADVIVVMARHVGDDSISAFIIEMNWPGVELKNRCHFMGLRALENGVVSFSNVKVPKENLIWEKGKGLKLALITLNTGRLALPAGILGCMKKSLEIARYWSRERRQWGKAIYQHEAIAHKIADLAASTFACESVSELGTALYDKHQDIRLEAAVAKLLCSELGWRGIDDLLQIRGGRGYETADSLKARGEANIPVERMMRDFRINRIFEGSTEIMHLFLAREALDKHFKIAGVMLDKEKSNFEKIMTFPKILFFYIGWYPTLWFSWDFWSNSHQSFLNRTTKKLARKIFHSMIYYGAKLQNKQMLLFRYVDIATEIYAMAASLSKANQLKKSGNSEAIKLANLFCENSRHRIAHIFRDLKHNSDKLKYSTTQEIEKDAFVWLEDGIIRMTEDQKERISPVGNFLQ